MSETYGVNTDEMAPGVSRLSDLETEIRGTYMSAATQLPAPGSVLGDPEKDPIAAEINNSFLPAVGQFLDGVKNAAAMVGEAALGVGTMVRGFDGTEEQNLESIHLSRSGEVNP